MRRLFAQRLLQNAHISRAWIYIFHVGRKTKAFFILLQHMQDVAFLRNSFNKFRQAENILRPFLFSFVSGRRRRCRAARVQWALPIHTHNCDRQADVGQVRGGAHLSRARSIQIGLFLSLSRSLARVRSSLIPSLSLSRLVSDHPVLRLPWPGSGAGGVTLVNTHLPLHARRAKFLAERLSQPARSSTAGAVNFRPDDSAHT